MYRLTNCNIASAYELRFNDVKQVDYHHYRHIIKNVELIRAPQHYTVPQHVAEVLDFVGGVFRFPSESNSIIRFYIHSIALFAPLEVPKPVFQWPGQPITPATILQLYNASSLPAYSANLQVRMHNTIKRLLPVEMFACLGLINF